MRITNRTPEDAQASNPFAAQPTSAHLITLAPGDPPVTITVTDGTDRYSLTFEAEAPAAQEPLPLEDPAGAPAELAEAPAEPAQADPAPEAPAAAEAPTHDDLIQAAIEPQIPPPAVPAEVDPTVTAPAPEATA